MKITIKKRAKSSITEDIGELELTPFTIFAGENNTGKTKLTNAIAEELKKEGVHVIEIPAERVRPEEEIKTGAEKDPFRAALSDLLEISFDNKSVESLIKDIEELLPAEFSAFNVENMEVAVKTTDEASLNAAYKKAIKETHIKSIIDSITFKDKWFNQEGIKLSEAGQGTQRLVIVSLLKYLGDKKAAKISSKLTYIIFEEPEIYLHPKLKATLFSTLLSLTEKGIGVIITTHDPYFIELGKDFKIYKVDRLGSSGATRMTEIKNEKYLPYDSSAEINYLVFGLPSRTYLLELYQNLKGGFSYQDFDTDLHTILNIPQDQPPDPGYTQQITIISRIRHDLAHPKSDLSTNRFNTFGQQVIEKLIEYKKLKNI